MICASIVATTTASAKEAMRHAAGDADVIELRLDLLETIDLPALLADRPRPVIVTARHPDHGGQWRGTEDERKAGRG